jgi:hypothetical protein
VCSARRVSILTSEPLTSSLIVPSGQRTMALMRARSLVNSFTYSVSYTTVSPSTESTVSPAERETYSKPSVRAASTIATSSGDGPCAQRVCVHAAVTLPDAIVDEATCDDRALGADSAHMVGIV